MTKRIDFSMSVVLILIGLLLNYNIVINAFSEFITKDWLEINADVVNSLLIEKGYFSKRTGLYIKDKYQYDISYHVDNVEIKTNVITSELVNKHVMLKYNPKNPHDSIILFNKESFLSIVNIIGLFLIVIGFMYLIKRYILQLLSKLKLGC